MQAKFQRSWRRWTIAQKAKVAAKVAESWTGQDSWAAEVDSQEVSLGHDPILLLAGG